MLRGTCKQRAVELVNAYPFLTLVYGYVKYTLNGNERIDGHWWCTDAEGYIADPTRAQFPVEQIEYIYDSRPVAFKCLNCGIPVLEGDESPFSYLCSHWCRNQFVETLSLFNW